MTSETLAGPVPLRLGREELVALVDALGFDRAALGQLIPGGQVVQGGPGQPDDLTRAALHSLAARRLVTFDRAGAMAVEAAAADVLRLLASPGLIVRLDRGRGAAITSVVWYASPERAIECRGEPAQVFQLAPVPIDELVGRVVAATGLTPRDAVDGPGAVVALAAATEAGAAVERGDRSGAERLLAPLAGERAAAAITAALATGGPVYGITTFFEPAEGRLEGGIVRWLDAGDAGLWRMDITGADGPDGTLGLHPVAGLELLEEIVGTLPG